MMNRFTRRIPLKHPVALFLCIAFTAAAQANLLTNGDFAAKTADGAPASWRIGKGQKVTLDTTQVPPGITQSIRVDVTADGGSSYGEVAQTVKAKPGTIYRIEGKTRSSKAAMAFFSVKLLKDGKEIKRIGFAKSQEKWSDSSDEFSSEEADSIQVLCRWEQSAKKGWVGQSCWFADLKLTEKGAAPPAPAWTTAIRKAAELKPAEAPPTPIKSSGDLFITPDGAGKKDGSNWDNALPGNAPAVIQAAWDALAPGQTCRIGSGIYINVSLAINSGGTAADKPKRLLGQDTGAGFPWFVGSWQPSIPDKGPGFISLANEVDYVTLENLQAARYQSVLNSRKGGHVGLNIRNFDAYEFRYGFYLQGFALADNPEVASHDITIQDCDFAHFVKTAIRLQAGNYDVRIINCTADAGGVDWMKEAFQICYMVAGDHPRRLSKPDEKPWASEHDILFINCVARNAIWSKSRYWQGDGFLCEGDVKNVAFINCSAFDNADGGWDAKASNVVYVNCVSMRNKMNYRVWHHGFFYNCLSAYGMKRGGSWTSSGLWTTGDTRAVRSTFHNNESRNFFADKKQRGDGPVDQGRITLERSIVSFDAGAKTEQLYVGESPTRTDTAESQPDSGPTPDYVAAAEGKNWLGTPADAFDSRRFGPEKGFHSSISAAWRAKTPEQLVQAARTLLKQSNWEEFKKTCEEMTSP